MIPMNRADPGKRSGASFWLGEVLLPAVREQVLYPAMEAIHRKYATEGGVHIVVQTTGDLLTWSLIDALVARHVSCLLISGVDSFHKGLETKAAQLGFVTRLTMLLETRGTEARARRRQAWPSHATGAADLPVFRRATGLVDWKALAARARHGERVVHRPAVRQLL